MVNVTNSDDKSAPGGRSESPEVNSDAPDVESDDVEVVVNLISSRIGAILSILRYSPGAERLVDGLEFVESVYDEYIRIDPTIKSSGVTFKVAETFDQRGLREMATVLDNIPASSFDSPEWRGYVSGLTAHVMEQLERAYDRVREGGFREEMRLREALIGLIEREKMRSKLNEISAAAEKASRTVSEIQEAAGDVAESELAHHFSTLAANERKFAEITRAGVFLIAVSVTIYAIVAFGVSRNDFFVARIGAKVGTDSPGASARSVLGARVIETSSNCQLVGDDRCSTQDNKGIYG